MKAEQLCWGDGKPAAAAAQRHGCWERKERVNHTKTTLRVWGGKEKEKCWVLLTGEGVFAPSPRTLLPAGRLPASLSQRGMSPVGLAGQEQPAQARGHGWSPPLFPGRGVALASPWLGFLRHKMEAAPSRGPSGAPVMLTTGSIRPETTLVRSGII